MKLLLINKNPVVSRMIKMSVQKAGDVELVESENINELPLENVDVVMIDDEMYDDTLLELLQSRISFKKIGLIASSEDGELKERFDFILPKPFLPTDLLELIRRLKEEVAQESDVKPQVGEDEEITLQEEKESATTEEESIPQEIASLHEAMQESKPLKESLVEIEEESPFIEEPPAKSGVLDEEEAKKVSELLNEEESQEVPIEEEPKEEVDKLETPELLSEPKEEDLQKASQVFEQIKPLSVADLKELLDGMQLDITIKISFPGKKDA